MSSVLWYGHTENLQSLSQRGDSFDLHGSVDGLSGGGNQGFGEAETRRLGESSRSMSHLTNFATESDFTERDHRGRKWLSGQCRQHGETQSEIGTRFGQLHTTDD